MTTTDNQIERKILTDLFDAYYHLDDLWDNQLDNPVSAFLKNYLIRGDFNFEEHQDLIVNQVIEINAENQALYEGKANYSGKFGTYKVVQSLFQFRHFDEIYRVAELEEIQSED